MTKAEYMEALNEHGARSRKQYIANLAKEYELDYSIVAAMADVLGPNEDFDGLVTAVQNEAERRDF